MVVFSSPEPKVHKVTLYCMVLEPASVGASVGPSVRAFTLSNLNISKTTRPITIKFYLKHHRF